MAHLKETGNWKFRSRVVTDDQSVLAYVMWNPNRLTAEDGATQVTAARMQVQANQINFDINAVADATIGTYAGNSGGDDAIVFADAPSTVRALIDRINGVELGIDRYRAGLGDFRPGFAIGAGDGLAVALTNIMLGWESRSVSCSWRTGLEVFADSSGLSTANIYGVGCGTGGAKRGGGQEFPDHLETEYTSTVAGVVTKVRAPVLSKERFFTSQMEVRITNIHFAAVFANNAKQIDIYDQNNNLIFSEVIGAGADLAGLDKYNFDNPIASGVGPLFVEAVGAAGLTDGPLKVQWYERVA